MNDEIIRTENVLRERPDIAELMIMASQLDHDEIVILTRYLQHDQNGQAMVHGKQ